MASPTYEQLLAINERLQAQVGRLPKRNDELEAGIAQLEKLLEERPRERTSATRRQPITRRFDIHIGQFCRPPPL